MSAELPFPAERAELADAAARLAARSVFDRPFALQAGAGTGKTTVLVARIARWCLGPGWERARARLPAHADAAPIARLALTRVRAITFTENAAAEMARRAAELLAELARAPQRARPGFDPAELALPPAELGVRAHALAGELEHLGASTIHGYAAALLLAHPLQAGIHPQARVDAQGTQRRELAGEVFAEQLRALYGDEPDADALALAADGIGPQKLQDALLGWAAAGRPAAELAHCAFDAQRVARARRELERTLADALAELDALLGGALAGAPPGADVKKLKKASEARVALRALQAALAPAPEAADALLAAEALCAPLRAPDVLVVLERRKDWCRGELSQAEDAALGARAPDFLARWNAFALHARALARVEPQRFERVRRLLAPLALELEKRLLARGWLSFADLLGMAERMLAREPELARQLAAGLDLLLVDEFQDTDAVQCCLIERLAFGAGERPALFVVGDPQQSIYGWRSADLAAYEDFLEHLRAAGGRIERLTVNLRSRPAVLAEVARVGERVLRAEPGVQAEFQALSAARAPAAPTLESTLEPSAEPRAHAPVEYLLVEAPTRAAAQVIEARAIATDRARLLRAGSGQLGRCALLLRATTRIDVYLHALREAGVPFRVEGDRSYWRRREVIDAVNLVCAALDRSDQIALVGFLRSPHVGVPDAAWPALWAEHLPEAVAQLEGGAEQDWSVLDALIERAARATQASTDAPLQAIAGWEHVLRHALRVLAELRHDFDLLDAARFAARTSSLLLTSAGESARMHGAHRQANLAQFERKLLEALLEGGRSALSVLRALRLRVGEGEAEHEGSPVDPGADALRIMSIHRAKGLEFDEVHLADLEHGARQRGALPSAFAIGPPAADGAELELCGLPSLGWHAILARRARTSEAEAARTLYVGMTRARERLVLSGIRTPRAQRSARSSAHADLLARRDSSEAFPPARAGARAHLDEHGVAWRVVDAQSPAAHARPDAASQPREPAVELEHARAQAHLLRARRAQAALRQARPLSATVSEVAAGARAQVAAADGALASERESRVDFEFEREPRFDAELDAHAEPRLAYAKTAAAALRRTERPKAQVQLARALGSAVHRALELWDHGREPALERARLAVLARPVPSALPAELAPEFERAWSTWMETLERSELLARLRAAPQRVLARELPFALAGSPERENEPLGACIGSIDLLWEDEQGELVVVDYKTERAPDAAARRASLERHAPQLELYLRAVAAGLGPERPLRAELWFLAEDRAERWPPASAT
jgi:ATP-dependent exoDNAse (exonuclease V) beta subunit